MRKTAFGMAAGLVMTMAMACGGDDNVNPSHLDGGPDGSTGLTDGPVNNQDGNGNMNGSDAGMDASDSSPISTPDGSDGSTSNPDGSDGGACDFATFVINMVNSNATTPSTDLGQNCIDRQDRTQFQSLFP